jgi:hypothetical protein
MRGLAQLIGDWGCNRLDGRNASGGRRFSCWELLLYLCKQSGWGVLVTTFYDESRGGVHWEFFAGFAKYTITVEATVLTVRYQEFVCSWDFPPNWTPGGLAGPDILTSPTVSQYPLARGAAAGSRLPGMDGRFRRCPSRPADVWWAHGVQFLDEWHATPTADLTIHGRSLWV